MIRLIQCMILKYNRDIDVLFDVGGVEQEGATEDSVDQRRLLLSQRLHP